MKLFVVILACGFLLSGFVPISQATPSCILTSCIVDRACVPGELCPLDHGAYKLSVHHDHGRPDNPDCIIGPSGAIFCVWIYWYDVYKLNCGGGVNGVECYEIGIAKVGYTAVPYFDYVGELLQLETEFCADEVCQVRSWREAEMGNAYDFFSGPWSPRLPGSTDTPIELKASIYFVHEGERTPLAVHRYTVNAWIDAVAT